MQLEQRCSKYIFILDLTPGLNRMRKDNCKTRRATFKFCYLMRIVLEIWRYKYVCVCVCVQANATMHYTLFTRVWLWITRQALSNIPKKHINCNQNEHIFAHPAQKTRNDYLCFFSNENDSALGHMYAQISDTGWFPVINRHNALKTHLIMRILSKNVLVILWDKTSNRFNIHLRW